MLRVAGDEGVSRLELAERAGLTPQGVSKIVARLRAEGLVTDAGRRASTGGKPATVLRLVPGAGGAVGVHLERDALVAVVVDLAGRVVAERRTAVDFGAGVEAVVELVAREVRLLAGGALAGGGPVEGASVGGGLMGASVSGASVSGAAAEGASAETGQAEAAPAKATPAPAAPLGDAPGASPAAGREAHVPGAGQPEGFPVAVLGVGVALPGPLDHERGVLHRVTGYPAWDGYPLRDALAARLGLPVVVDKDTNAAALGLALSGGGAESFAYLHLGTGLGAGLVLGGGLHRGARTGAGEFGHHVVLLDGPACECGDRGCLEALCLAAVARGDLDEAARVLGTGAGNLVALLDIDRVLLGGRTVAAAGDVFVRGVAAVVAARTRREGARTGVGVALAPGGERSVAEGAAQLVLAPLFGRADGV
ncbi:ROK family transcriptional regulator [Streptomyces sp. CC224B]|uniref:ROK family transcriptional regulator n=1 Tax=Streptomyces sp. CC224B TaxID=3044571 RepID=UPI0024A7F257|nr:ROK family transcriptional regulator [Streptomyces sp. CC224B]